MGAIGLSIETKIQEHTQSSIVSNNNLEARMKNSVDETKVEPHVESFCTYPKIVYSANSQTKDKRQLRAKNRNAFKKQMQ